MMGTVIFSLCSCGDSGELAYTLNEDRESYSVSGLGTHTGKKVVVPETYNDLPVTGICEKAFFNNEIIQSIIIPDSVTVIGEQAFAACSNLKSVKIGSGVTRIERKTFDGCPKLKSVTLSDKLVYIGEAAFNDCSALKSINLPNSITDIDESAFYKCAALTDVIIPNKLTTIRRHTFSGCSSLKSVTVPSSVSFIDGYAFSECSSLSSVYIESLSAWCNIAFADELANPLFIASKLYLNGKLVTDLVIPDDVTSIPAGAFHSVSCFKSITVPKQVTHIGNEAFYGCASLTNIYFDAEKIDELSQNHQIFSNAGADGTGITVTVGKNATEVPDYLFFENANVTRLVFIENSVCKSIGTSAFCASGLEGITLPDSVTSIEDGAFEYCKKIRSVVIGHHLQSVAVLAFGGCERLRSVTLGTGLTALSASAFSRSEKLIEIVNNSALSVEIEGVYVHAGESEMVLQDGYLFCRIGGTNYLLDYTKNDTNLTLPESFGGDSYEIIENAFREANITGVVMGNGVVKIGDFAFYNCTNLTTVVMGDGVEVVGSCAFSSCTKLENLTVGKNVEIIEGHAFQYCSAFKSIVLGNKITFIGNCAFADCDALKDVYYRGTSEEWKNIIIENPNDPLINAARHCGYTK